MRLLNSILLITTSLCFLLQPVQTAIAQGSAEDYERAAGLGKRFANKVFRDKVEPQWFDESRQFWYRVQTGPTTHEYIHVNATTKTREPAFDHKALAAELAKVTGKEISAENLPIKTLVIDPAHPGKVWIDSNGGFEWDGSTGKLRKPEKNPKVEKSEGERSDGGKNRRRGPRRGWDQGRSDRSPDSQWKVEVENHNLVIVSLAKKENGAEAEPKKQLTSNGTEDNPYTGGFVWAPNSKYFVGFRKKKVEERIVHVVESSPKDQLQPKLHERRYTKPGDELSVAIPHLFDVEEAKEIPLKRDLFENPWSINQLRWDKDSSRFTFLYNQRGHQVLRIVAVDAETGVVNSLIEEAPETFVCYSSKALHYYLPKTNELIWSSERDGWHHLYLYDFKTGKLRNQITKGQWLVRKVGHIDEENRTIRFTAGGIHPDQDPYHVHHARIGFDGSNMAVLTDGDGNHDIRFSPGGNYIIDRYSRVDLAPVHELRDAKTGELTCKLEEADITALQSNGWQTPERFVAKGRDDKTDIHGVIHRPSNFDPGKKYPVIEYIYAGPHSAFVPKSFRVHSKRNELAELGFIIVQIDGMGTSHRSKAFHDVCWKNLGDSGFPDRILWIKAAAEKHSSMDISRVGIYGGSAGGQSSTRAMLGHGDFYKVAVSDCGCHDNRMDKIWWNEQWMGYPIGDHYHEQSNVTQAHNLTGKLFLIVGELDSNVDPASTMQVVNALIKADKDFDLLVVPGGGHGIAESKYGTRRRRDFFVRHLLGVEPRWKTESKTSLNQSTGP